MARRHYRSPYTQRPRSDLHSRCPRPTRTNLIFMHPRSRHRGVRHRQRNRLERIRPRTLTLLLRRIPLPASLIHTPTHAADAGAHPHLHLPPDPNSPPSATPLKNVGHSLQSSGRDVGSFRINERIAAASSGWTCWRCESTNLDASRHCRVCSHLRLFKEFGWR